MGISSLYTKLGQRVKSLRQQRGLSQEKLALDAGFSRTYVGAVERGQKRISLEMLNKIAHTLGLPLKAFFDLES